MGFVVAVALAKVAFVAGSVADDDAVAVAGIRVAEAVVVFDEVAVLVGLVE